MTGKLAEDRLDKRLSTSNCNFYNKYAEFVKSRNLSLSSP